MTKIEMRKFDGKAAAARVRAANADASGDSKPTNPKDAVGSRKARWFSYLPLRVLVGVGLAMLEGARKYGRHNYRIAGVRASVYIDACVSGHLTPWTEGEDIDPDSGLNHIDKAIATLMVLRDGMYEGNWVDDRAPSVHGWTEFMAEAHRKAAEIIDRYPNAKDAFIKADTIPRVAVTLKPLKKGCRHSLTTVGDPRNPMGPLQDHCDRCGGYRENNKFHVDDH